MSDPVSSTRLYLGNLPRHATKQDVENHFAEHGGKINEIKLMNGFGFIEFDDELDARDIVPAYHGSTFMGERLTVQFAKGSRREPNPYHERPPPRPRRTPFRMSITDLPVETSWQDLKDFARQSGLDVVYSEVSRERDGRGFVEYETLNDLRSAVEKLDQNEFKGQAVHCIADPQDERAFRDRHRSRSPGAAPYRRPGYPPAAQPEEYDYNRRGPPRGYSPRRDDYRRRSPPRDYYARYDRSPRGGPRGPAEEGYGPPPRQRYGEDPYGGPPPRGGPRPYDDPYANGGGGGGGGGGGYGGHGGHGGGGRPQYDGPPPRARRSPPNRPPYDGGYERPRHW